MKLKYQFVLREISGQTVAVAVGVDHEKFNGMVKLNQTGAYLMELLNGKDMSHEELLEAMVSRYDVSRERASENLDSFLRVLRQGGLLTE